jgi:hypothetical protein
VEKNPHEAWTGKKPSLEHLIVFGCDAYVHVFGCDMVIIINGYMVLSLRQARDLSKSYCAVIVFSLGL